MTENTIIWIINWFNEHTPNLEVDLMNHLEESYFELGLIDSFGIIEFITAIEADFSIQLTPSHFQDRRFATIKGLANIIDSLVSK